MIEGKKVTATSQLTKLFIGLFVGLLVVVNLIFIVAASRQIYQYAADQAEDITEAVVKDWTPQRDWSSLLNAYVARQDDDAIEITTATKRHYHSPKAPKIFGRIHHRRFAIKDLQFTKKGIYYLRQQHFSRNRVRVAINVDDLVKLVGLLLVTMILASFIMVLIAIPLIRRLARRWTVPLTTISQEVSTIDPTSKNLQTVTVPDSPVEIHKVAFSFNDLLTRQHQVIQREKEFVANASHELKTPLAGILGHVNLIKRHGQDHPEVIGQSLPYIDREAQRMKRMINDLLTLEGHYSQEAPTIVDLPPLIKEEVSSLKGAYHQHFNCDLPITCRYRITSNDFRSLVHNLVENAAKYSPADSPIEVSLQKATDHLVLTVADQGSGITPANREKIFDRFYREDESHASSIPGSGIGLAIVKAIIEKYHGTIKVGPNQPCGTIFTVTLPVEK